MRFRLSLLGVLVPLVFGCHPNKPLNRDMNEAGMFGAASMRLHPTFTQVKDWNNDGKPDGIEAVLELQDQFGEPTRAAGRVMFELFEYRPHYANPRGPRLANPWIVTLTTRQEQEARWNRTLRAYSFQLEFPAVESKTTYVLTATFEHNEGRLFDQLFVGPQS